MKNGGVFLGGLVSLILCNLLLVSVCPSVPARTAAAPAAPPPVPAAAPPPPAIVPARLAPPDVASVPIGLFLWGCGGRRFVDPEGSAPLPICPPVTRL